MDRDRDISKYVTSGPDGTREVAVKVADMTGLGDIVLVCGEMGAGKTVFVQGFAKAKGFHDIVTSPTFALVNEYAGDIKIYHFDIFRLGRTKETDWLDDYFFGDGICIIEWAEFIDAALTETAFKITISKNIAYGTDYREISLKIPKSHKKH